MDELKERVVSLEKGLSRLQRLQVITLYVIISTNLAWAVWSVAHHSIVTG